MKTKTNPLGVRLAHLCAALLLALATGCRTPCATVVLVRHAEKGPGADPSLTPAGQQRAQELADVVAAAGITTIYVSEALRTQETAAPIAAQLGLTPIVFPVGTDAAAHAQSLAADLLQNHADEGVLVVGHSNTVPLILQQLGVAAPPSIGDQEFGHLFVLVKKKGAPARLVHGRYGT